MLPDNQQEETASTLTNYYVILMNPAQHYPIEFEGKNGGKGINSTTT